MATFIKQHHRPITVSYQQYTFFLSHGKIGMDALHVWAHMLYTGSKYGTQRIQFTNKYGARGMHLGEKRIEKAKSFLRRNGFTDYEKEYCGGKIKYWLVRLHKILRRRTVERMYAEDAAENGITEYCPVCEEPLIGGVCLRCAYTLAHLRNGDGELTEEKYREVKLTSLEESDKHYEHLRELVIEHLRERHT